MSNSTDLELEKLAQMLKLLEKTADLIQRTSPRSICESEIDFMKQILKEQFGDENSRHSDIPTR